MNRYAFRKAVGGLFLAEYDGLRRRLPKGVWPLEAQPGFGVLAMTCFDFVDTEIGPYGEFILSVIVMPWASPDEQLPDAAYCPFLLATTTVPSRRHAAERWHLPVYERCIDTVFEEDGDRRSVSIGDAGESILRLEVGRFGGEASTRHYQAWSGTTRLYRGNIGISGFMDEHEEESGSLQTFDHALGQDLAGLIEDDQPFREQSMDAGVKTYSDLVPHVGTVR